MKLLLLLFCLFAWASAVQADALAMLGKMHQALGNLNYEGTFIVKHGKEVESMRIAHAKTEKGIKEHLLSLTGAAREVVKENEYLTCVLPDMKAVVVEPAKQVSELPLHVFDSPESITRYYALNVQGSERIAGIHCQTLHIKPKDKYRYGYRLCIDKAHGMLLKSELLDGQQQALEQMMFTEIAFHQHIPDSRFEIVTPREGFAVHKAEADDSAVATESKHRQWQFANLPAGFDIISHSVKAMSASPNPVQHFVLSDGLASVSVFIAIPTGLERKQKPDQENRYGAMHAKVALKNKHLITVVGEVPLSTVRYIFQAIEHTS